MSLAVEEPNELGIFKAMIVDTLDETQAELEFDAKVVLFDEKYLPALKETWLTDSYGDEFENEADKLASINYNIANDTAKVIAHITGAMSVQKPAEKKSVEENVEPEAGDDKPERAVKIPLGRKKVKTARPAKKAAETEPKPEPELKPKPITPVIKVVAPPKDKAAEKAEIVELRRIIGLLPEDLREAYAKIAKYTTPNKIPIDLRPDAQTISDIRAVFADITVKYAKKAPAEKTAAEQFFLSEFIAIENRAVFKFAMAIDALKNEKRFFYAGDVNKEGAEYNQMLDFPALRKTLQTRLKQTAAVNYLSENLKDEKFTSFFYLPSKEKEWKTLVDFVESGNLERLTEMRKKAPKIPASIVINPDNLAYLLQLTDAQIDLIVAKKFPDGFLYDPQTKHDRDRFLEFAQTPAFELWKNWGCEAKIAHSNENGNPAKRKILENSAQNSILASLGPIQGKEYFELKEGRLEFDKLAKSESKFLTNALKAGLSVGFLAKLAVAANGKTGILVESAKEMFAELGNDKKFSSHDYFLPQLALYRDVKTVAPNCKFAWGEKGQLTITHGEKTYEYKSPADYSRVMSEILGREPQKPAEGAISASTQNDDTTIGGKKYKLEIRLYETPIEVGGKTFKIATKVSTPKNSDSEHIQPVYKFVSRDLAMNLAYEMGKSGATSRV